MKKWWQLWKKERPRQQREPRILQIPDEHLRCIYELADAYNSAPANANKLARHKLWEAIAKIHPEVTTGAWRIHLESLSIDVVEIV